MNEVFSLIRENQLLVLVVGLLVCILAFYVIKRNYNKKDEYIKKDDQKYTW